jgi:hypothetical protein
MDGEVISVSQFREGWLGALESNKLSSEGLAETSLLWTILFLA